MNKTNLIFVIGGLLNALCIGYVVFGVTERSSLESQTQSLSGNITRLERQLPDPSSMLALSNQIRTLKDRNRTLKTSMRYDFGDVLPEEEPDSPEVEVGDRLSFARDKINDLYSSRGRSVPEDALGLPDQPDQQRYRDQLRQINVARHLHKLLLDKNVDSISGIKSNNLSPDERIVKTLQNLDQMDLLCSPLTVSFDATLENTLSVLHALQTPSSYLQILTLSIEAQEGETAGTSNDLLLSVECTVAPVYSGEALDKAPAGDTDTSGTSSDGDGGDDDGDSSFFN